MLKRDNISQTDPCATQRPRMRDVAQGRLFLESGLPVLVLINGYALDRRPTSNGFR